MSRFKLEDTVRINFTIGKKLYEQTLPLAEEEGLRYPEYMRLLLLEEIKRKQTPPSVPEDPTYRGSNLTANINFKKRQQLLKAMREIRNVLD